MLTLLQSAMKQKKIGGEEFEERLGWSFGEGVH